MAIRKLKKYKPTRFMAETSHYDKKEADLVVGFFEQLKHTKGEFYKQPFELIDWQEQIIRDVFGILKPDGYRQFNTVYVEIPKKNGKQLDILTPIPTPDGFTCMGDLKVGDTVFDEQGMQCHVVAKSAVDDTEQAYRLTFRDGSSIIAGERHLWNCDYVYGKTKKVQWTTGEIYRRTQKYREHYIDNPIESKRSIIRIPVAGALMTSDVEVPVDPYLYGYWLGNGNATKPEITVRDGDVEDIISFIPYKPHNRFPQKCGGSEILYYSELKPILLDSFREKKIRQEYLRASKAQRWALLQGLMDSDGCIGERKAQSVYVTTIIELAESVRELLWSLGIKNAVKAEPSTRYGWPTGEILYVIRFTTFDDQPTSRLIRKNLRQRIRKKKTRSNYHYLKSIEPLDHQVQMQCIQVDSPSHQYLAGTSMVPTHNSELAAAVALYMLCADGEQRAEVYGCAADRDQASIVFNVACDMVKLCPSLMKRCKIGKSRKTIDFGPTNSIYKAVSADVGGKSGVNVSALIFDELWVQKDRRFYDMMTVGTSDARKNPLHFIITTAGNDQNSICYEIHQKAVDILEGRKFDPNFYPVIYGAEQDEDWTDPKVWAKANPSLGITIGLDKVEAACEQARQNPGEENSFRQLRLDQWVKQAVRWMPMDKWDACAFPVNPAELEGRTCYGGLDLSSTTDITAFVLAFPPRDDDEKYILMPFFWVPEDTLDLRVRRDHVPYDKWEKTGHLITTEGNVVHYGFIEQFIVDLGEKYHIREIAFDRWNATMLTQNLEGDGFTMVPFGQGYKDMSPPTKELMKLTLEGKIAHGGHPVLRWMMDNIFIRTDPAGNIKADKEKSTEKIDGAVASIMALDRAIRCGNDPGGSIYDTRGLLSF